MADPTIQNVHYDAMLTNLSIALLQEQDTFIAPKIFKVLGVPLKSAKYFKYDTADWAREEAQLRAPATESAGSGYNLSQDSYSADVFAVHKDVDDQTRANQTDPIDIDSEAARWVANQILLKLESQFISNFVAASTWTGTASAADQTGVSGTPSTNQFKQWNDLTSDPISDITRYVDEMQEKTGKRANTLVVGTRTAAALRNHPDIIDRIKYTRPGFLTLDIVAGAFGLDHIYEARATRNTAAEGATASYSYYMNKTALLLYVAPTVGPLTATAGLTFAWDGYTGTSGIQGLGIGVKTRKFRMESIESDRIEAGMAFDMKVVAPDLGIYMASAVA